MTIQEIFKTHVLEEIFQNGYPTDLTNQHPFDFFIKSEVDSGETVGESPLGTEWNFSVVSEYAYMNIKELRGLMQRKYDVLEKLKRKIENNSSEEYLAINEAEVSDEEKNDYEEDSKVLKEINYEVYTRNPRDLNVSGWDIKHVSVIADSDKQARELLSMWKLFDCVILKNFICEVKEERGFYPVSETMKGQHGWIFDTEWENDKRVYKPLVTDIDIESIETEPEMPDLFSKHGFYIYEACQSMQEEVYVSHHKSLKEARVAGVKHAYQYSEDEPAINTKPITDGGYDEVWVGEIEDGNCHADVGVRIIKGSYLLADALLKFRRYEGKDWVEKLCDAWSTGSYNSHHKEYQHLLQRFRNEVEDFDLDDVQKKTTAEEIAKKLDELESQENDEFDELGLE